MPFCLKQNFLCIKCLWKGRMSKTEQVGYVQYHVYLHILFSVSYRNTEIQSENLFISNFYTLLGFSACLSEDWEMDVGSLATSQAPNIVSQWPWKPARLHCYPSVNYKCARHPKRRGGRAIMGRYPREYAQCHPWLERRPLENQMLKRGMMNCSLGQSCKWVEAPKMEGLRQGRFQRIQISVHEKTVS